MPTLRLPVARAGHLIAMKLLARDDRNRPADADDLTQMAGIADEHEWEVAMNAVERRSIGVSVAVHQVRNGCSA